MPILNGTAVEIGLVDDPDAGTTVAKDIGGLVDVAALSATFPSLFEPTRRIISGVEKSAGPKVSATKPVVFRLSLLGFFAPVKNVLKVKF